MKRRSIRYEHAPRPCAVFAGHEQQVLTGAEATGGEVHLAPSDAVEERPSRGIEKMHLSATSIRAAHGDARSILQERDVDGGCEESGADIDLHRADLRCAALTTRIVGGQRHIMAAGLVEGDAHRILFR